MADPKQVHIQGDVNISPGLDVALGPGSLYIVGTNSILDVEGLTNLDQTTIDTTDGVFSVTGANKISFTPTAAVEVLAGGTSFFKNSTGNLSIESQAGILNMDGNAVTIDSNVTTVAVTGATGVNITSSANNVTVDASANFDVNAQAAITMDANAASNFTVNGGGNLSLTSDAGRAILTGGGAASNAITIDASNAAGGIDINAGTAGIDILATNGGFSIDAQNVASNISLATNANAQDFSISLTGTSDSSIVVDSSGSGVDAIKITASSATGGIDIDTGTSGLALDSTGPVSIDAAGTSNFTTTGAFNLSLISTGGSSILQGGVAAVDAVRIFANNAAGGVDIDAGTGGITADTTAGFSIDSATTSNITLTGTDDLTINNTGGSLVLRSTEAAQDAVRIFANNAAGGIDVDSGTGGVTIDSQGLVSIDAVGAASNFSLSTNGNAQDLTVAVTGTSDSSLNLTSTGTSATDAINIIASAGGINMEGAGSVKIDTTDLINGIFIATETPGVPVTIGTSTSSTIIAGDLTVSGTTTTINTETLTIEDNIIFVNSSNGELGADGGLVVRRNQTANNTGLGGDVVLDTGAGAVTGAFQAGSATPGTLVLATGASAVNDFYNGWWIKVTSGTGNNQIRRIKTYNGTTRTASLYVTVDNTTTFLDGLDLATAPAAADTYTLFNSPYIASFYDESADKWVFAFTNITPDPVPTAGISTVIVQRYAAMETGAITIQGNGNPADSVLNVNVINELTSDVGVTIEGVNINNGLINGAAQDVTEIVLLPDNATTLVEITGTATVGSFMVFVDAVQSASGAASYLRQNGGAYAMFAIASSGTGGAINRLVSTKASTNQRVDGDWQTGEKFKIQHKPAKTGGTGALIPYRVKIQRVV